MTGRNHLVESVFERLRYHRAFCEEQSRDRKAGYLAICRGSRPAIGSKTKHYRSDFDGLLLTLELRAYKSQRRRLLPFT